MIKAIIFDLGGVLFVNSTSKFIEYLAEKSHLERDKVKDLIDGELGSSYREAKITRDEFWKRLLKELNLNKNVDELENRWIDGYKLIEGTRDLVQELSKNTRFCFSRTTLKKELKNSIRIIIFFLGLKEEYFLTKQVLENPTPPFINLHWKKQK